MSARKRTLKQLRKKKRSLIRQLHGKTITPGIKNYIAFFLVMLAKYGALADDPARKYNLIKAAEDLNTLSRLLNGMAIAQELAAGNIKEEDVAGELIGLKQSILKEMEKVVSLDADFNKVGAAVEKACGNGAAECGDLTPVKKGITEIQSLQGSLDFSKVEKVISDDGPVGRMIKIGEFKGRISGLANLITPVLEDLKQLESGSITESKTIQNLFNHITDTLATLSREFTSYFAFDFSQSLEIPALKTAFEDVLALKNLAAQLQAKSQEILDLNSSLDALNVIRTNVESLVSAKTLGKIVGKMENLVRISGNAEISMNDKNLTFGFFNGNKDFAKLTLDLSSKFLQNVVAPESSVEKLKNLLQPIIALGKKIEKVAEPIDWQKVKNSAPPLTNDFKDADADLAVLNKIPEIHECTKDLKFNGTFDLTFWEDELGRVNKYGDFSKLAKDMNSTAIHQPSDELKEFATFVKNPANANNIASFPELANITAEVQSLSDRLSFLSNARLPNLPLSDVLKPEIKKIRDFLDSVKLLPVFNCLAKVDVPKVDSLKALKKLSEKSDKDKMKVIFDLMAKLRAKLKILKRARRRARAANRNTKVKNPFDTAKKFSYGAKYIVDLSKVAPLKKEIEALLAAADKIDEEIEKLTDPAAKAEIRKYWNNDSKSTLRASLTNLEVADKALAESPRQITDYSRIFVYSKDIKMDTFDGEKLSKALSVIQTQAGIQHILPKISTLKLEFGDARQRLEQAKNSLKGIQEYMDGFFNNKRPVNSEEKDGNEQAEEQAEEPKEDDSPTLHIVLGCVGGAMVLGVAGAGLFLWKTERWPFKKKKTVDLNNLPELEAPKKEIVKTKTTNGKPAVMRVSLAQDDTIHPESLHVEDEIEKEKHDSAPENPQEEGKSNKKKKLSKKSGNKKRRKNKKKGKKGSKESQSSVEKELSNEKELSAEEKQRKHMEKIESIITKFLERYPGIKWKEFYRKADVNMIRVNKLDPNDPDSILCAPYVGIQGEQEAKIKTDDKNREKEYYSIPKEYPIEAIHRQIPPREPAPYQPTKNDLIIKGVEKSYVVGKKHDTDAVMIDWETLEPTQASSRSVSASRKKRNTLDETQTEEATLVKKDSNITARSFASGDKCRSELIQMHFDGEVEYCECRDNIVMVVETMRKSYEEQFLAGLRRVFIATYADMKTQGLVMTKEEMYQHAMNESKKADRLNAGKDDKTNEPVWMPEFRKILEEKDSTEKYIKLLRIMLSADYRYDIEFDHTGKKGPKYPIPAVVYMDIVHQAAMLFDKEPACLRTNVQHYRVIGDIHGKFDDLVRQIHEFFEDANRPTSFFVGDYVDRGKRGLDSVFILVLLKKVMPTRLRMLLGNHETETINSKYGFLDECIATYGGVIGRQVFEAVNAFFKKLPIFIVLNEKIAMCHGGLSPLFREGEIAYNYISKNPKTAKELQMYCDLIWNDIALIFDPKDPNSVVQVRNKRCNFAVQLNHKGIEEVFEKFGWKLLIRGHEVPTYGYNIFLNLGITVFGATNTQSKRHKACQLIGNGDEISFVTFYNMDKIEGMNDEDTYDETTDKK